MPKCDRHFWAAAIEFTDDCPGTEAGTAVRWKLRLRHCAKPFVNTVSRPPFSLVLDCHSGFGFDDHLWFPYAYSKKPIAHLPEVYALKQLLNQTYPHLDYRFEPQSISYTTHGDLWDYLYLESQSLNTCFLPLTMEMGSWRWIKKNPRQLASVTGLFNPILPHRLKRVLRRHTVLMEFLLRACYSWHQWIPHESERENLRKVAGDHWYSKSGSR